MGVLKTVVSKQSQQEAVIDELRGGRGNNEIEDTPETAFEAGRRAGRNESAQSETNRNERLSRIKQPAITFDFGKGKSKK